MITGRLWNFPYWGWGNPNEEMIRMRREMNRLLGDLADYTPRYESAGVFPLVNIFEDKDGYLICAELPGLDGEDLEITSKGKSLTISGEPKPLYMPMKLSRSVSKPSAGRLAE